MPRIELDESYRCQCGRDVELVSARTRGGTRIVFHQSWVPVSIAGRWRRVSIRSEYLQVPLNA